MIALAALYRKLYFIGVNSDLGSWIMNGFYFNLYTLLYFYFVKENIFCNLQK